MKWVPKITIARSTPLRMVVTQPVVAYLIRMRDLSSIMLKTQAEKLMSVMSEQPNEGEVQAMWAERQSALQWQSFRKTVMRDARAALKMEKAIANGEFGLRRPAPPKPIKDHPPFTPVRDGRPIRIVTALQHRVDGPDPILPCRPRLASQTLRNG